MAEPRELFEGLAEEPAPAAVGASVGTPRLRVANRDQLSWQMVDVDSLLPADHAARAVWEFVMGLDLSELLAAIKAREGEPGRDATDPRILMALWLYATIDGVGSARELARLCAVHAVYQWICGSVSTNYHTLSDFRSARGPLLDRLLSQGVASLVAEGLVTLERLAQDGVRIRASAGGGSFRRRERLESLRIEAEERVAQLKTQLESDAKPVTPKQKRARERAARERVERTQAALERMKELEEQRERREQTHKKDTEKQKPPRASTTDSDARVMKMADNGYRPAYNGQFASDPKTQVIVAVDVDTNGSDGGLMGRMQQQIIATYGVTPKEYLADGGFNKTEDIEQAHAAGIAVFVPPSNHKSKADPYAPRKGDGPGTKAWRERMSSNEGKAIYRERCKHECVNAHLRNRGGTRLLVRGRDKVKTVLKWFAVAHNLLRAVALRKAAGAGAAPLPAAA